MKSFLIALLLLSPLAIADEILITDVAIKAGDQVIVYVDDIGRFVTVAANDDIKIVFDAEDVLPGRHEVLVRVVDGKLKTVKEIRKTIEVD
jgi:hypothetical protein